MAFFNYTTTIKANKTVSEIQELLSSKGAKKIMLDYDENRLISQLSFCINHNGNDIHFILPSNWQGVLRALKKHKVSKKYQTQEHAINVCWRIIRTWLLAQMAIIESGQIELPTLFLHSAIMQNGRTVADNFLNESEGVQLLRLN